MSRDEEDMTHSDWRTALGVVVGLAIGVAFTIAATQFIFPFG